MVRKKDHAFWKYVDQLPGNRWKCKYCEKVVKGGRPNRIVTHLAKKTGRGIVPCGGNVPDDVHAEALTEFNREAPDMQQQQIEETAHQNDQGIGSENNPNVQPSSDNNLLHDLQPADQYASGEASHLVVPGGSSVPFGNNVLDPAMLHAQSQQPDPLLNSSFLQWNEVNTTIITAQDLHWQNMHGLGAEMPSVSECSEFDQSLLTLKRKLEDLSNQKEEKKEELHQLSKKVRTIKRGYKRMKGQSKGNHPTSEQLKEVKELINQAEELGNLHVPEKEISRSAPSSKAPRLLTSKLFGRYYEVSEIRRSLARDDILRIGIYGMGGVGKTEIMMNIYNELLENEAFDNVFWVTMPKKFNVYELQSVIGTAVHLEELSNEKDEKIRAAMLYRFFTSGKKYVIILDGLWRPFDYNVIGIPLKYDGLKLAITCQSLCVLRSMFCQKQIQISPFGYAVRDLFKHELGEEMGIPSGAEEIAEDIVGSCRGLPLYIKAAATRLRGVTAVQEWRDMREKMKEPKERFHTLKSEVFDQLKLSYELLNDHELQQYLIFCAFFCGIIELPTLREMEKFFVDIGVIDQRNSREKSSYRFRNNLKELQKACLLSIEDCYGGEEIEMHESIRDMALHVAADTNVSMIDCGQVEGSNELWLMRDARDEISKSSSNEIRLPILMSKEDCSLRMIPDSLSIVFSEIQFLDVSGSKIEELPNFVSDLVKLTALVLRDCSELRRIPNIGKLTSLRHLDLFKCNQLKDLPDGLEDLVNLEYLNLHFESVEKIPRGVLRKLRKLQYLCCNFVKAKELKGLVMLQQLYCMLTLKEQANFANSFNKKELFTLIVASSEERPLDEICELEEGPYYENHKRIVVLYDRQDEEREDIFFPKNIRALHMRYYRSQRIRWSDCVGGENLEKLHIYRCNGLEEIIAAPSLLHPNRFSCLKCLSVYSCDKMKRLLNQDMLQHLSKLEVIEVASCTNMDELISTSNGCTSGAITPLPKLTTLKLWYLPELRSIGAIAIAWPIETITVYKCPKLKKIPLERDLFDDEPLEINIGEHEMEWWKSLEWESPEAKQALQAHLRPRPDEEICREMLDSFLKQLH